MFVYADLQGYSFGHSLLEGGSLVAFAVAAWVTRDHQRLASVVCSVGLISTSAMLVHVSGGVIEAHFHFFVMIILLTLYEDWLPFLVAAGYVLLHHAVTGIVDPAAVYNHPDALAHPIKWAAIHALFVTAAGFAGVVAWRLNEGYRAETERALLLARENERSMAEAQALAGVGGFEYFIEAEELRWSDQLFRVFGFEPGDPQPTPDQHSARIPPDDLAVMGAAFERAVTNRALFSHQYRYRHPDGSMRVIHVRAELAADDGNAARMVGTCQDVSERETAREDALRRAEMQRVVTRLGELALAATDLDRLFNEAVKTVAGALGEMAAVSEWVPGDDQFVILAEAGMGNSGGARYAAGRGSQSGYTLLTGKPVVVDDWETEERFGQPEVTERTGERSSMTVPVSRRESPFGVLGVLSAEPNRFDDDAVTFAQAVANVLSAAIDRVEAEEEVRHRALHDPLTGLPNRVLFLDRLEQALAHAKRTGNRVGVLFCDLDQFKLVNDSLGHEAGDELLGAVAPRFAGVLRAGDTVARFGGDEFGFLVADAKSLRDVTRVAERIAAVLAAPFPLRGREYYVSASVGIAVSDGSGTPEALIRDSDLAMYRAKERGRGRYEIFDRLMRERAVEHLRTENDLRRALARDELVIHYQPVVGVSDGSITGFEALVRWEHPERGLLSPGEFIPLAEESELIVELGDRVLRHACEQTVAWHRLRPDDPPFGISVNVSPRQIADRMLPERVAEVLEDTGIDPSCLSLEVTESVLVDELESPMVAFERLKALGVGLVLDDFGTGFSSLGYLRRFPFDVLKIDRSFVSNLGIDPANAAIIRSVTAIAQVLGLGVVAEGVETEEHRAAVEELGCHFAQGFLFGRPQPAAETAVLLQRPANVPLG
jgi:diguanylate cyclase (GGDEF)-like protein/PAS domain S-box-containing protein